MATRGRPKGLPKTGGRGKGVLNKATADVKALAQKYGPEAIETLVGILQNSDADAAKIAAAKELLDRGYGKATQPLTGAGDAPLIPTTIQFIREPDPA